MWYEGSGYDYELIMEGAESLRIGLIVDFIGLIMIVIATLGAVSHGVYLALKYGEVSLSFLAPVVLISSAVYSIFYYYNYVGFARLCEGFGGVEDIFCLMKKLSLAVIVGAIIISVVSIPLLSSIKIKIDGGVEMVELSGVMVVSIPLAMVTLLIMAVYYSALRRLGEVAEVEKLELGAKIGYAYLIFEFLSKLLNALSVVSFILFLIALALIYRGLEAVRDTAEEYYYRHAYQERIETL